jgi:hypothetical protein
MAAAPGKKFVFGGLKPRMATAAEKAEAKIQIDQTGDLTALNRSADFPSGEAFGAFEGYFRNAPTQEGLLEAAKGRQEAPVKAKPVPKAPIAAKAKAPEALAAPLQRAPSPGAAVPKKTINFNKFGEAKDFAITIRSEESANPYVVKSTKTPFPLTSRMGFQKQILKVFNEFIKVPEFGQEPDFDACKKMGAGAQQQVEMYEYQKFVREYVRQATPYRGLLVYHGLGSGKTCSAIAAAEALFSVSKKKIIVMTPSSLRYNFVREVSFCGFRHFRYTNHWVKLDGTQPTIRLFSTQILNLPDTYTKKHTNIWVPDYSKKANFSELDDEDRREITLQLEAQITGTIKFVNYNGIKASKLKAIACKRDENGDGFFDNSVIVVDEIHNITRLMQGTIEPYLTALPGLKRKVPLEPVKPGPWNPELCKKAIDPRRPYLTNYKRGYLLYRMLSGARNSKIIGLSGTPLINFPEEVAILANLVGGYIHTSSFTVTPASEVNERFIRQTLQENLNVDFEEVNVLGTNIKVLFTLLPEGMAKAVAADGTLGVMRLPAGTKTPTIEEITATVVGLFTAKGMKIIGEPVLSSEPLLPPIGEEFRTNFIAEDGKTLKNTAVLRKRLQGLVSYYRGNKKELMPTVTKDEVVRVPFTPFAQAEYQRVRGEELRIQEEQKSKPKGTVAGAQGKMANLWAEIYELTKLKQPNSYRMASRQACNFAFPEGIVRPRPGNQKDASAELGVEKEDIIDGDAGGAEGAEEAGPRLEALDEEDEELLGDEEDARGEDEEIDEGTKAEAVAEAKAAGDEEEAEELEKEGEAVLVDALDAVAAPGELAPAAAARAAAPAGEKKTLSAAQVMMAKQAKEAEDCKRGLIPGEEYLVATARAKRCLKTFATPRLRLFPRGQNLTEKVRAGDAPDPNGLMKYSPKFAAILTKILEAPGSSLVYSQFLDMEGIGIFSTVLDINDFHRIDIEVDEGGQMRFSKVTIANLKKGPGQNRYLTFTGAQGADKWKGSNAIRNMALKVFNARFKEAEEGSEAVGSFTDLPPEMSKVLVDAGFKGNLTGELCRVFCITSAGAEGLSLRNVRRVHIMEPYWNHVRTDQVKGRAVRICSHIDLDYSSDPSLNQRTVEVYTYCSVFDPQALVKPDGSAGFPRIEQPLLNGDGIKPTEAEELGFSVPPGAKDYVLTSDEYLYQMSERKKSILQNIQNLMKTNAVDCQINAYENEDEGLGCIILPGNPSQYAFHPDLKKDIAETSTKLPDAAVEGMAQKGEAAFAPGGAAAEAELAPELRGEGEEAPPPLAAVPMPALAAPKAKPVIRAFEIFVDKTPYLAVPVIPKGQLLPLSYDLYARGDIRRTRKIGTTLADAEGNPTSDIDLF